MTSNGFQASAYAATEKVTASSAGSGELDHGIDASSSSFFSTDYKKHDDLKTMLDSNKDGPKLEAMRRIISMVARGRDCSDLFPAVVKNVVSKNVEVKKLVYVYLTRYAEEQQDLALLSISTFQRALKDPNQLIRASALRVLSSIRVSMIVPIMMLAIKDAVTDMSPYVRKTAAHAIPKLYSLDSDQKDDLIEVIDKLLADRTTLVAGSAIQAFEEVCPDRIDLIHKHYRKLCNLLVDVEEWGQVVIINMLTRYVRTQFIDPNKKGNDSVVKSEETAFYSDEEETTEVIPPSHNNHSDKIPAEKPQKEEEESNEEDDDSEEDEESDEDDSDDDDDDDNPSSKSNKVADKVKAGSSVVPPQSFTTPPVKTKDPHSLDPDHRLLLRNSKPLLNSRNSAVVMAVAQLYYHCAPVQELPIVAKAMIRLMRCNKEVQYIVLSNIASITIERRSLFEAYIKSFYVHSCDPTQVKLLKLEILTNLATETSISTILREFQTYVTSTDKEFVAATIQAIGRCASNISEVTDTCLGGLAHLMSKKDEAVVAESVVVIRKLLQMQSSDHKDIIIHMARLVDDITVPMARASILWLIGEYCDRVPKIAPDVLRKMAKSFCQEQDIVKLQILNLAAKLCINNAKQSRLLAQYVFNLAKYDQNYDIRDRSRFLRALIFHQQQNSTADSNGGSTNQISYLAKHVKKIFLATKPAPLLQSKFKDRHQYQMGSLSHLLNHPATGYHNLPGWPDVAPDPTTRDVEMPTISSPTHFSSDASQDLFGGNLPWKPTRSSASPQITGKDTIDKFYSDEEEDDDDEEGESDQESEDEDGETEDESEEESEEESDASSDTKKPTAIGSSNKATGDVKRKSAATNNLSAAAVGSQKSRTKSATSESEVVTSEVTSSSEEEETSSGDEVLPPPQPTKKKPQSKSVVPPTASSKKKDKTPPKKDYDLLLDFDDNPSTTTIPLSNYSAPVIDILTPITNSQDQLTTAHGNTPIAKTDSGTLDVYIPTNLTSRTFELIGKYSSGGVLTAEYRFPRSISVFNPSMVTVEIHFTNHSKQPIRSLQVGATKLQANMELQPFPEIGVLGPQATTSVVISIDFRDTMQSASFELVYEQQKTISVGGDEEEEVRWEKKKVDVVVKPTVGELLQPVSMTNKEFSVLQSKLTGMNESSGKVNIPSSRRDVKFLTTSVYNLANIVSVSAGTSSNEALTLRYAGKTVSGQLPCLIELTIAAAEEGGEDQCVCKLKINCEKITVGSMLLKELIASLKSVVV